MKPSHCSYDSRSLQVVPTYSTLDVQFQGGGQKVRILKRSLEIYKDRNDVILLFTDA